MNTSSNTHAAAGPHTPEVLAWYSAEGPHLPDSDMTVLVQLDDDDEDTWLGFLDADGWRSATTGGHFAGRVLHWCEMPTGPARARPLCPGGV